jgi:hypothetical protein
MGPKTNHLIRIGDFSLGHHADSADNFGHVTQVEGIMGLEGCGLQVFLNLLINLKGGVYNLTF